MEEIDGAYHICYEKRGSGMGYVLHDGSWKTLIKGEAMKDMSLSGEIVYKSQLSKKAKTKTVETLEPIETFVSLNGVLAQTIQQKQLLRLKYWITRWVWRMFRLWF